MRIDRIFPSPKRVAALLTAVWLAFATASVWSQQPSPPPPLPPAGQTLTPDQLDDLVAPVALYPDELVSQIMVAATYPLEVVEAYQFMQQNPGLKGQALTQAGQKQDWDPSVQALLMFPDVLKLLNDDVTWTTNLGNAFLAQQESVMDAVQRMRRNAEKAGKLKSTPQQTVEEHDGYVDIEPVSPDVIYVPVYNPLWIWGPALWYPYPTWYWPPFGFFGPGVYCGFGLGIDVGLFFGVGWHGWGGWGWHPHWGHHAIIVNNGFVHEFGFNGRHLERTRGTSTWAHDASHRGGVPYPTARLTNEYRGNVRQALSARAMPEVSRNFAGRSNERLGERNIPANRSFEERNRSAFDGQEFGAGAQTHAEHGFSSMGPMRSEPRPMPRMSMPRMSMPRAEAGGRRR